MFRYRNHCNSLFTRALGSYYGEVGLRELWMTVSLPFPKLMKNALQHEIWAYVSCFIIKDVPVPLERSQMCPCAWLPSKVRKSLKATPPTFFRYSLPYITTTWPCSASEKLMSQCRAPTVCVVIDSYRICKFCKQKSVTWNTLAAFRNAAIHNVLLKLGMWPYSIAKRNYKPIPQFGTTDVV